MFITLSEHMEKKYGLSSFPSSSLISFTLINFSFSLLSLVSVTLHYLRDCTRKRMITQLYAGQDSDRCLH